MSLKLTCQFGQAVDPEMLEKLKETAPSLKEMAVVVQVSYVFDNLNEFGEVIQAFEARTGLESGDYSIEMSTVHD